MSCSTAAETDGPGRTAPTTLQVPGDADTISAAVDQAIEGDVIEVAPGSYHETVLIDVPGVILRGTDRNEVIIDGELTRDDGVIVTAPGVAVQNLTVVNHLQNGVLVTGMLDHAHHHAHGEDRSTYEKLDPEEFPPLQGFHVDHVTAANNGLYGVYAFNSQHGIISDSYASGSADSGFYVGQCQPCDVLVTGNVAEANAVGFEDANAGGNLWVVGNRFVGNRVGATFNSDYQEAYLPQAGATLAGNVIALNNGEETPAQADGGFGTGVGIGGGTENTVVRNLIRGHARAGLLFASSEDLAPLHNTTTDNRFAGNRVHVHNATGARGPAGENCLHDNEFRSPATSGVAGSPDCEDGRVDGPGSHPTGVSAPPGIPFSDVALPPVQPSGGLEAVQHDTDLAFDGELDLAQYPLPAVDLLAGRSRIE